MQLTDIVIHDSLSTRGFKINNKTTKRNYIKIKNCELLILHKKYLYIL